MLCSGALSLAGFHAAASMRGDEKPARLALLDLPVCATTTPITSGTPVSGSLGTGDCTLPDGVFFDYYSFSATTGQPISVSMASTAFDTYLYLYASDGTLLLMNDDSSSGASNARLPIDDGVYIIPKTGNYFIVATSYQVSSGNYTLSLNTDSNCSPSASLSLGVPVDGSVSNTDCKVNGGGDIYYTDFFNFNATVGQKITVTLSTTSSTFDPYLIVRPPSGNNTMEDDDSGGGSSARVPATGSYTVTEAGNHLIEVAGYSPLETGNYTVTVSLGTCSYAISPTSISAAAGGGPASVSVTADAGCAWTASSNAAWITVTSGSSGSGNGTVSLTVAANTGSARTGTVTIAGQTYTVNQSAAAQGSIAGSVRYYFGATPLAVSGVTITAAGTPVVTATSAADGSYSLTGFGAGAYAVTPSKTGQVAGISSLDASRAAQFAAGLTTLTANQQIAADATNNGSVSSLDASRIAQTAAGIANSGIAGTWKFAPSVRNYTSVTGAVTGENFDAIMVGDVTGNWAPPAGLTDEVTVNDILPGLFEASVPGDARAEAASDSVRPADVSVSVEAAIPSRRNAQMGELMVIPVVVGDLTGRNIMAVDLELSFDPSVLRPVAVDNSGSLASNFRVVANAGTEGRLRVSAFGVAPISGAGDFIYITFEVIGARGSGAIRWESLAFNEGEVPVRTMDGSVRVRRAFR